MARDPLILALANPEPEILPELAKAVRPDAIIATGRSDYPNQVNNVLCFPFIFRGALDVGATSITEAMKLACMRAIAELAHAEQSDIVAQAYAGRGPRVRSRIPDPEALRSAAHGDRAAGGGEGRDGQRRGHASDRRFRRVPRAPVAIHLSLEPHHEAGVRRRQALAEARRVRRGRGGARAARGPGRRRRRAGEARADRPPGGHRRAHREVRLAPARRRRTSSSSTSTATRAIASAGSSTTS